jgi:hypothetical protein
MRAVRRRRRTQFDSLDAAREAYASGGYVELSGRLALPRRDHPHRSDDAAAQAA